MHGSGVQAGSAGVLLYMVEKWLGYAQLLATAIYSDAVGAEEQSILVKMWGIERRAIRGDMCSDLRSSPRGGLLRASW